MLLKGYSVPLEVSRWPARNPAGHLGWISSWICSIYTFPGSGYLPGYRIPGTKKPLDFSRGLTPAKRNN